MAPLSFSISRPATIAIGGAFYRNNVPRPPALFHENDYLGSSSSIQDGSRRRKHLGNRSSVSISVWDESLPPTLRMVGRRNVVATQLWSGIMGRKRRIGFRSVRSNGDKKKEEAHLSRLSLRCARNVLRDVMIQPRSPAYWPGVFSRDVHTKRGCLNRDLTEIIVFDGCAVYCIQIKEFLTFVVFNKIPFVCERFT